MPLYANVYRKRQFPPPLRRYRFWPITREMLRTLLGRRLLLLLLFAGWLPFFGVVLYLVGARLLFQGAIPATPFDAALLARWLSWQTLVAAFLTTFVGADTIAEDLRSGGVVLHLSRSLTRRDYVVGKLLAPLACNLAVTSVPAGLLIVIGAALEPRAAMSWRALGLAGAALSHTIVVSVFFGLTAIAFSALTRNVALAGFSFFLLVVPLDATLALAAGWLSAPALMLLSIRTGLDTIGAALLGAPAGSGPGWAAHSAVLAAIGAAGIAVLRACIRPEQSIS